MKLIFYHTDDTQNTINKTLNKITELDIHLPSVQNLNNPLLLLTKNSDIDYSTINYAQILNNYYFASSELTKNGAFIKFNLKKDVLETYKDDILNSDAVIIEKATPNNTGIIKTSKEVETFTYPSSIILPKTQSIIMVSVATNGD